MGKRKKLTPEIRSVNSQEFGLIQWKDNGPLDESTLIAFESEEEKSSFFDAQKVCVNQDASFNDVSQFLTRGIEKHVEGDKYKIEFTEPRLVKNRQPWRGLPKVLNQKDFLELVDSHLKSIESANENPSAKPNDLPKKLLASLFKRNERVKDTPYFGVTMATLAIMSAKGSVYEVLRDKEITHRKKLLNKIKTVEAMFQYGLIADSVWSAAPFWNSVRSKLKLEYDSICEDKIFSPFQQEFISLKQIINLSGIPAALIYDSILDIMIYYEIKAQYSGKGVLVPKEPRELANFREYLRRQITDKLRHLPDEPSDSGFDIYNLHQKF